MAELGLVWEQEEVEAEEEEKVKDEVVMNERRSGRLGLFLDGRLRE